MQRKRLVTIARKKSEELQILSTHRIYTMTVIPLKKSIIILYFLEGCQSAGDHSLQHECSGHTGHIT